MLTISATTAGIFGVINGIFLATMSGSIGIFMKFEFKKSGVWHLNAQNWRSKCWNLTFINLIPGIRKTEPQTITKNIE